MLHKLLGESLPGYHDTHTNHEFGIYVPSTVDVDKPLTPEQHRDIADHVATMFSKRFGGATVVPGHGSWVDDKTGKLVKEPVYIVSSATRAEPGKRQTIITVIPCR